MGAPTGVPAARLSHTGRTGGGVLAQCAGLLIDTRAVMPSDSGVVWSDGASALGCMMIVSASLTEHARPAPKLAVVEKKPKKKPH